jgi:hypothetical protein
MPSFFNPLSWKNRNEPQLGDEHGQTRKERKINPKFETRNSKARGAGALLRIQMTKTGNQEEEKGRAEKDGS